MIKTDRHYGYYLAQRLDSFYNTFLIVNGLCGEKFSFVRVMNLIK